MAGFSIEEKRIRSLLSAGNTFLFNNEVYKVLNTGKPTCSKGEPKTDIYVFAKNQANKNIELKISFKKANADFLENKTNSDRAEQLLGSQWDQIVIDSTLEIKDRFLSRPLIYKQRYKKTEKGAITLGWKFELLNKPGGELSEKMNLSREQVIDVYAGSNLMDDKRDSVVDGRVIPNSGIANYILINENVTNTQEVINSLIPIEQYVDKYPDIYFACKALNYRSFDEKWDGDRPLSVFIDWKVENNKLVPVYVFNSPLIIKGNEVARKLIMSMKLLNIRNTDDINIDNIANSSIVYGL